MIYVARTGRPVADIKRMLKVDTWMGADEALKLGFATKVSDDIEYQMSAGTELPERVKAALAAKAGRPAAARTTPAAIWNSHLNHFKGAR